MKRLAPLLLSLGLGACSASAEDFYADFTLIHSDVPLWGSDDARTWPRHFTEGDRFGCKHRIKLGDWRLDQGDRETMGEWIRLQNYGVMHCFIVEARAHSPDYLSRRGYEYSVLLDLGTTRGRRGEVNLWALQSGSAPGSDYMLLASKPNGGEPIGEFDVLRRRCPKDRLRIGPSLDILGTKYCAINSQAELIALAQRMADAPPLGRLTYRGPAPEEEDE